MDERDSRRDAPLVCVTDGKHHVRQFLREVLSQFSFTIYECVELRELNDALEARQPDLVVLGLTAGAMAGGDSAKHFEGKVLPFAPRDSAALAPIQDLAERLGISLLPPLLMPFSKERLRESIATFCPTNRQALWWTWPKPCAAAGSSCGISRKSTPVLSSCAASKPFCAFAIPSGASFPRPISCLPTATLASRRSPNR